MINSTHYFQNPKVTSSNCLFWPNNTHVLHSSKTQSQFLPFSISTNMTAGLCVRSVFVHPKQPNALMLAAAAS